MTCVRLQAVKSRVCNFVDVTRKRGMPDYRDIAYYVRLRPDYIGKNPAGVPDLVGFFVSV